MKSLDTQLIESNLIDAVLRLQRHLDALAKLRAECEPYCEGRRLWVGN